MKDYGAGSIITDTGLQVYRRRPTQYINDMEHGGLNHIASEIISNAFDEAAMQPHDVSYTHIMMCPDPERDTYQLVVVDNGRGFPLTGDDFLRSFTQPNSSGKFIAGAYEGSGGLFGHGAKVVAALAYRFRVVTVRDGASGSIYVEEGKHAPLPSITMDDGGYKGTTVIFEPDATIFLGISNYATEGYVGILNELMRYSYFNPNRNIKFYLSPTPFKKTIWKCDNITMLNTVRKYMDRSEVIFNGDTFDRETWIKHHLGITKSITWSHKLKHDRNAGEKLGFELHMYYAKNSSTINKLGLVNRINIDRADSDHVRTTYATLDEQIASRITSPPVRSFYLEQYKLPVNVAINIEYNGAEFTGATKHNFTNAEFRNLYGKMLNDYLNSEVNKQALNTLFDLIIDDITAKYEASLQSTKVIKGSDRLYLQLKRPTKFVKPTVLNSDSELFIVEGDSAGESDTRTANQGIYKLSGKTLNPLSTMVHRDVVLKDIMRNKVYHDIFTILNMNVFNPSLSNLRFKRIIVLTDADEHGKHIAAILIGLFKYVCPEFVSAGRLCLAVPPFYGLTYTGKGHKQILLNNDDASMIYLRNRSDVIYWMASVVYTNAISLKAQLGTNPPVALTQEQFIDLCRIVVIIGETIDSLAEELAIDPLVLEALTTVTQYLTPQFMDTDVVCKRIGADRVIYTPADNILTVVIGLKDFTIPLYKLSIKLYETIMPMLAKISVGGNICNILVTSKHSDVWKDHLVSIYQLYKVFLKLDSEFTIARFKGVGSMPSPARFTTCLDPDNRIMMQVRSIQDSDRIFNLLGTESAYRKQLLQR